MTYQIEVFDCDPLGTPIDTLDAFYVCSRTCARAIIDECVAEDLHGGRGDVAGDSRDGLAVTVETLAGIIQYDTVYTGDTITERYCAACEAWLGPEPSDRLTLTGLSA